MTYLAILAMMLIAFAVVGWPLVSSPRGPRRQATVGSPSDELLGERDAAYQAIKELDFEHDLGNLSESDYRMLRDRYRGEAAATLQKLDAVAEKPASTEAPPAAAVATAERVSKQRTEAGLTCPSCGSRSQPGDRFCAACGGQLGRSCSSCGVSALAEDRFCGSCGAPLEARA
jgi:rRNA maturation endonuclease Nob1